MEWLNTQLSKLEKQPKSEDPVVTIAKMKAERDALVAMARPILNKPKPKPPKEEKKKEEKKDEDKEMKTPTEDKMEEGEGEKMDVDEKDA